MAETPDIVTAIRTGSESAFGTIVEAHRRELRVHCYRMLGCYSDADELTQETFLKAWRARQQFNGQATLRAWLYRIATNTCVDTIRRRPERHIRPTADRVPPSDLAWLQPFPDTLLNNNANLDDIADDPQATPEAQALSTETIGLAFLATIQLLPARQRAALILRDVLEWNAADTAALLDTTVASANSLLQRARTTMRGHNYTPAEHARSTATTDDEQSLLTRYIDAHRNADPSMIVALLHEDIRVTMPPHTVCYDGTDAATEFFTDLFNPEHGHEFRLVPIRANGHPAAANYFREPGQDMFRAFSIDVLNIINHQLIDVTTFFVPEMFPLFGLPPFL